MEMSGQIQVPATLSQERTPARISQEAGCVPESVWTVSLNRKFPALERMRTTTVQTVAQLLYRLRYAGSDDHLYMVLITYI